MIESEPIKYDPKMKNVAWALCKCPLPISYGIPIPITHDFGWKEYPFKCNKCGLSGVMMSKGLKDHSVKDL